MTLDQLPAGARGRIAGVHGDGPVMQRILQLGLLPGGDVEMVRRAPSGDPLEVRVLGYCLSLRRQEARLVELGDLA